MRGFSFAKTRAVAAKAARTPVRGVRPGGSDDSLARLNAARRKLVSEAAELELELERLHAAITSGMIPRAAPGASGDLEAAVARARELRNELQEKRLEVLRVERNIGREKQLRGGTRAEAEVEAPSGSVPAPRPQAKLAPRAAKSPERRRAVLSALGDASFPDHSEAVVVKRIAEGLLHDDPDVRREAVMKLASRPQFTTRLLLVAAEDSNERVRLAALSGLSGCKDRAAVELFRRFLRDKSSTLRLAALRGLAAADARLLGNSDLMATIEDSDPAVRRAAAALLGWRREGGRVPAGVLSALGFALYDEEEAVRLAAAEALGAAGDDRSVFSLIRALGDPAEAVREAASRSFSSLVHDAPSAEKLSPRERVAALKAWWTEARVGERLPQPEGREHVAAPKRAAEVVAEIKTQLAEVAARAESVEPFSAPPEGLRIAKSAVPAAAPEPDAEDADGEFMSILGDDESPASEAAVPEPEAPKPAAASAEPKPKPKPEKTELESVIGDSAGDADAADEEYESVLGDEG